MRDDKRENGQAEVPALAGANRSHNSSRETEKEVHDA
jgi:hypothetical protein